MKNIIFITSSLGFGGAAKMLSFVAESLCDRGHNVSILNLRETAITVNFKRSISDKITVIDACGLGRKDQIIKAYQASKQMKADIIIGFKNLKSFMLMLLGFKVLLKYEFTAGHTPHSA